MARRAEGRMRDRRRSDRDRGALGGLLIAFLLGVLVTAGATVALTLVDDGDDPAAGQSPAASPTSDASDDAPTSGASGDVPDSCVQAAEYNETLTQAIDEIALGARDQDAARLADALDAIQDAQPGSEAASQECRALAGEGPAESTEEVSEEESEDDSDSAPTDSPEPTEGAATPTPTP